MRRSAWTILPTACLVALVAGCSAKAVPSLPAVLAHPEFVYPAVPQSLQSLDAIGRIERGWRFLQNDDTANAAREFQAAVDEAPAFYPAQVGSAYVAVARRDHERALELFEAALRASPAYVPALIGRGQTLLLLERYGAALEAYEAALVADGSLVEVRRIVDGLRFRAMQDLIESARSAASAGRVDEARAAYVRALEISPDSAFLHRELGMLERRRGDVAAALDRFRQAASLDPDDTVSAIQTGELLEQQGDYVGAEAAYRRAAGIEPSADLTARIAARVLEGERRPVAGRISGYRFGRRDHERRSCRADRCPTRGRPSDERSGERRDDGYPRALGLVMDRAGGASRCD